MLTPIWLMGLAALTADRGALLASAVPGLRRAASVVAAALVCGFAVISALGLFDRLPLQRRYCGRTRPPCPGGVPGAGCPRRRRCRAHASGASGWYFTPYYDLHHNVPPYWPLSNGFREVAEQPARYVSHVIARRGAAAPLGFRELQRVGRSAIWRRVVDPPFTDEAFGYERRIHAAQPVTTPSAVARPRWCPRPRGRVRRVGPGAPGR